MQRNSVTPTALASGAPEVGFTLLEIMISVVVLTVGLMGVLALFPVAIKNSAETIRETTGVMLAQSVEQAIRDGLRTRKGQSKDGKWTYFIFQHEGVRDMPPRTIGEAEPSRDYYILLPDSENNGRTVARQSAYEKGRVFVYPETDGLDWEDPSGTMQEDRGGASPNGNGNPTRADDDNDDRDYEDGSQGFEVYRPYYLGQKTEEELELEEDSLFEVDADPRSTYSYAFAIRRALNDANALTQSSGFSPLGELFEVEIMIFRSFVRGTTQADPVYSTTILVEEVAVFSAAEDSIMKQHPQSISQGGFTLLELMVALALAAVISLLVSIVGTQAQELYRATTAKVEVYQNLRYVTNDLQTTLEGMIPTADLEFFVDSEDRRNDHWDSGEELRDRDNDGGRLGYYDEAAFHIERTYTLNKGGIQEEHNCDSLYFKAPLDIDGEVRLCNVEYYLTRPDPERRTEDGEATLEPIPAEVDYNRGFLMIKTVRYVIADLQKPEVKVSKRKYELIRNITDLKFEYYFDNPFDRQPGDFYTPSRERSTFGRNKSETKIVDIDEPAGQSTGVLKEFMYGGLRDFGPRSRGVADSGNQVGSRESGRFTPLNFSVLRGTAGVQFSQLSYGAPIYIWTEQGQTTGGEFATGDYTLFRNEQGRLEFIEQIDTASWEQQVVTDLRYRAGYVPSAIRVTVRILNDKGNEPRTHSFVVHPFRRI